MPSQTPRLPNPLRHLPAVLGTHAGALRGLGALASRLYVYLAGFAAIFLMAAHVTPAQFGEYSLYQSVLEVGLVLGTLGSALLFSRHAVGSSAPVHRGDTVRTLAIGLPLAVGLIAALLALQRIPVAGWSFALIVATLAMFAFNNLRLAYGRGRGHTGLLNLESGLRSTLLVLAVGGFAALGGSATGAGAAAAGGLGVPQLLAVNLAGVLVVGVAVLHASRSARPPPGSARLGLAAQGSATVYALLMFLLRKSDLLVVAFFMPLAYVGAFKLAFLLAEAPSQFVQTWLYTKTPAMLEASEHMLDAQVLQLARQALLLGCALFLALAALIALAAPLLRIGREALEIFLCMAPYFLLRTYTVHHEMLLALRVPISSLRRWALLEVALRLASYGAVVVAFPAKPHYVFFVAVVTDFLLYEIRMRAQFGAFPIGRIAAALTTRRKQALP